MKVGPVREIEQDKGYAWLVLVIVIFYGALISGFICTFGILLPVYLDEFHVTKTQISLIQSFFNGAAGGFGLVAGTLIKLCGVRNIAIVSILLGFCGFLISGFINNLPGLVITHGLLPGFCTAMLLCLDEVVIAVYFNKRKTLAFSLYSAGFSVGYIMYAPIIEALVETYGRKGSQILFSGIVLQGLIGAMLLHTESNDTDLEKVEVETCDEPSKEVEMTHKADNEETICNHDVEDAISEDKNIELHEGEKEAKIELITNKNPRPNRCNMLLKSAIKHVTFMKRPELVFYMISFMLLITSHNMPFYFLPAKAKATGLSLEQGALLVSVIGLSGLGSRPVFGFMADKYKSKRTFIYGFSGAVSGFFTAISYFFTDFILLLCYSVSFGIINAGYMGVHAAVLSDLLPLKSLPVAIGIKSTVTGAFSAGAQVFVGWLVDWTDSFGTPFLVFGILQMFGGFFGLLILWNQYHLQCCRTNNSENNSDRDVITDTAKDEA